MLVSYQEVNQAWLAPPDPPAVIAPSHTGPETEPESLPNNRDIEVPTIE
jgi:hypothetical protein